MADQEANVANEKFDYYITTKDNPYDPKSQFDEWYTYDLMLGYNTLQRLAKMEDYLTNELKIDDETQMQNVAMSELIRLDPLKVYIVRKYPHEEEGVIPSTEESKKMIELGSKL